MKIHEFLKALPERYEVDGYLEVIKGNKLIASGTLYEDDDDWWAKSETKTSVRIRNIMWSEMNKIEFQKDKRITGNDAYGYDEREYEVIKIYI